MRNTNPDTFNHSSVEFTDTMHLKSEQDLFRNNLTKKIGFWELDIQSNTMFWSAELYNAFNIDPSANPNSLNNLSSILVPESWEKLKNQVEIALKTGKNFEIELKYNPVNETIRFGYAKGWLNNTDKKITKISGTVQDIPDHKIQDMALIKAYNEVEKLNKLHNVINQCNKILTGKTLEHDILSSICKLLVDSGIFNMCWIGHVNNKTSMVEPIIIENDIFDYVKNIKVFTDDRPEGQGPIGIAIRECKTTVLQDAFTDPRMEPWVKLRKKTTWNSSIALPLILKNGIKFVLVVYANEINYFGTKEIELLESIVQNVQLTLEKNQITTELIRTQAQLKESNRLLKVINDCNLELVGTKTEDEILSKICQLLIDSEIFNFCDISRFNENTRTLETMISIPANEKFTKNYKKHSGLCHEHNPVVKALNTNKSVIINDLFQQKKVCSKQNSTFGNSSISIPIIISHKEKIVLSVHTNKENYFEPHETALLETIASNIKTFLERKRLEGQILNSEKYLKKSQEIGKLGSWVIDCNGTVERSESMNKLFNLSSEEIQHENDFSFKTVHPEDRAELREWLKSGFEGKTAIPNEIRSYDNEGKLRYYSNLYDIVYGTNGEVIKLIGITQDITDIKLYQLSLKNSEIFTKSALNALTAEIAILNETGDIIHVNTNWEKFSEQNNNSNNTPINYKGLNYIEICDKTIGEEETYAKLVSNSIKEIIRGTKKYFTLEYPCHSLTEKRWFRMQISGFTISDAKYVVVAHENITDLVLSQEKLIESEERYRTLVNELQVGVIVHDSNAEIILSNNKALHLLGLTSEQITGKTSFDKSWRVIHEDGSDFPGPTHPAPMAIKTGKSVKQVVMGVYRPQGDLVWLQVNAEPLFDQDKNITKVIVTFEDISELKSTKDELISSKRFLRTIIDTEPECVKVINDQGELIEMNASGLQMLDVKSIDEVNKKKLINFIMPNHQNSFIKLGKKVMAGKKGKLQFEILSATGNKKWLETTAVPIKDKNNKTLNILSLTRDITLTKKNEELLRESEERYRSLVNLLPDALVVLKNRKIIFINHSFIELFQIKDSEKCLNTSLLNFVYNEDKLRIKEQIDETSISDNIPIIESKFVKKDKSVFDGESIARSIVFEGQSASLIIIRDKTETNKIIQDRSDVENKFRFITDQLSIGIIRVDLKSEKVLNANAVCLKLFGYDNEEYFKLNFNKTSDHYVNIEDRNSILYELKSRGFVLNKEVEFKKNDSEKFWASVTYTLAKDKNTVEAVIYDITEIKTNEEKLKKNIEEKNLLIKEIHHRVKNNLQIISSLLKLQLYKVNNVNQKTPINESIERIRTIALVHEKIYFSDNLSEINFGEYLKALTKQILWFGTGKNIQLNFNLVTFNVNIEVAIPLALACYEIISNAYKHAFKIKTSECMNISISLKQNICLIEITDTGDGFNKDLIDYSKSLGFTLIENLIKQVKGTYTINSQIGFGTEFKIELPIEK